MVHTTDLAYLAGFVDGEGCFSAKGNRSGYGPRFSMSQKDSKILYWIQEEFQMGTIHHTGGMNRIYIGKKADLRRFILMLLPYLRLKKPQAELSLLMIDMEPKDRAKARVELSKLKEVTDG